MADNYSFPQQAPGITKGSSEKGIAKMHHPDVGSLRFRTAPTEFAWDYIVNKRIDNTYGGRVIQLLGTKIDNFVFKADSAGGRWEYSNKIAKYMRDVLIAQRNGTPATFEYTTRGWKVNLYIASVPFQDAIEEVRREFTVQCKVQEDVSAVMSKNMLEAELTRLQDGLNFRRSKYNDPLLQASGVSLNDSEKAQVLAQQTVETINQGVDLFNQFGANLNYLPNGLPAFSLGNLLGTVGG